MVTGKLSYFWFWVELGPPPPTQPGERLPEDKYPSITTADLWVLAAYCAIEHTAGPVIEFRGGRRDAPEAKAVAPGRLPGAEAGADEGMEVARGALDASGGAQVPFWGLPCAPRLGLAGPGREAPARAEGVAPLVAARGTRHRTLGSLVAASIERPLRKRFPASQDLQGLNRHSLGDP